MPPVRHNPSQRVHDRVIPTGAPLQPTAETSPSFNALQNSSQKQHLGLVWNGHQVTPAAHYLLINGVDPSILHDFSPVYILDSSCIFDPSSNLPLPPKPDATNTQDRGPAQLIHRATSVPSDPSLLASPSSSTTPSLTLGPPISKLHTYSSASLPSTADTSSTVCTYQPSSQPARPPNNFFLFRADYFARVKSLRLPSHHYASLPKDHDQWDQAPESVKAYYRELAGLTKEVHGRLHPNYKYKPRNKEERQRQKEEKIRLRQETMAKAKARRADKAQVKSSTTHVAGTAPPPAPKPSVDFRIYDPSRRAYYRHHPSEARSPPPLPSRALLFSPPASSPPPAPSGVRNTAKFQDADPIFSSSLLHTTSPAETLFQVEDSESSPFDDPSCTTDEDAHNGQLDGPSGPWSTIEDDVDWYRVAPPRRPEPTNHILSCGDENACHNCSAVSWSDELHIDIPTASTTPTTFTRTGCSFNLNDASYAPSLCTLSSETSQPANASLEALSALTTVAAGDWTMDRFWDGLSETRHDPPPASSHYSVPPTVCDERTWN